jgi:hypothetical protein
MGTSFSNFIDQPDLRKACMIAQILLDVYCADVVDLVVCGVEAECSKSSSQADRAGRTTGAWPKRRLKELETWRRHSTPLGYDALESLINAVSDSPETAKKGLPRTKDHTLDHGSFGRLLVEKSPKIDSHVMMPPFWSDGSLRHVMHIGLRYLSLFSNHIEEKDQIEFAQKVLAYVAHKRNIRFVPWTKKGSESGRQTLKVVFNQWRPLSTPQQAMTSSTVVAQLLQQSSPPESPSKAIAKRTQHLDENGDWDTKDYKIVDLHQILHKRTLPTNWNIDALNLGQSGYVAETYQWVTANMDLSKPIHQLALLGGILFSRLGKRLGHEMKPTDLPSNADSETLTKAIRTQQWKEMDRRRVAESADLSMLTFTVAFLGFQESGSPLRTYLESNSNRCGPDWNKHHSTSQYLVSHNIK